jgi:hypothetical protein
MMAANDFYHACVLYARELFTNEGGALNADGDPVKHAGLSEPAQEAAYALERLARVPKRARRHFELLLAGIALGYADVASTMRAKQRAAAARTNAPRIQKAGELAESICTAYAEKLRIGYRKMTAIYRNLAAEFKLSEKQIRHHLNVNNRMRRTSRKRGEKSLHVR